MTVAFESLIDARARRIAREHTDFSAWPQPGAALGLLAGLFVGMLLLMLTDLRQVVAGKVTGFEAVNNLAMIALLIVPLISGIYAVKLPRDEIQEKDFAYTYCARCPRWVLLQGYFLSSLYELRLTLAFLAGAVPFFAAGLIGATLRRSLREGAMLFGDTGDVIGMLVFYLAFSISLWGFSLLMTAIGTLEGLRGRSWPVTILRVLVPLVLLALPFLLALMLVGAVLTTPYEFLSAGQKALLITVALLVTAYPFAATFYLIRNRQEGLPVGGR